MAYQQQQNNVAPQYGQQTQFGQQQPAKPPSTKIEGFPLLHFAGYISLVTTDPPRSELEKPVTTLYILAPYLGASSAPSSLSLPEDYGDVTNPFNLKLKACSPEILRARNNFKIKLNHPYAFIAALQPDAWNNQGNKYPIWKGHLIWIGVSFDDPDSRRGLYLPGMEQPSSHPGDPK